MDIYAYLDKYKNVTFEEKEFNEIDNLVFSSLIYLDFTDLFENVNTIKSVGKTFLNKYALKETSKYGIAQKDAYKILKVIFNSFRYMDVEMSNYQYITSDKGQFSAVTFQINKGLLYIAFEGTDHLVSGWKEDFQLSYLYPIPSQAHAISYINNNVKLFGPKVIVGGHSKGGNLALVGAMGTKFYKKFKIKQIYSNDGPGLRLKEFTSRKYKRIKKKLIHIVPYTSIVGIMLRNDLYKVIKSTKKTIMSHAVTTWVVEDDRLVECEFDQKIIDLEKRMLSWLDDHDDVLRKKMIENVFRVFEEIDVTDMRSLTNIPTIIKLIKEVKNIDEDTKELVMDFINYNFIEFIKL